MCARCRSPTVGPPRCRAPGPAERGQGEGRGAPGPGEQWSGEGQRPRRRLVQAQRLLPATLAPSRETESELGGSLAQNGGNSDNDRASPNRIFLKSDAFKTLRRAAPTRGNSGSPPFPEPRPRVSRALHALLENTAPLILSTAA